jgi:hypothetical protein
LPKSRRRRDGDGVPDNTRPDLRTQADFGAGNGIEAETADAGRTDVGKRVGGAALFVAVIGGVRLRRRIMQALADVADHVRQRQLLPGQQLDQQPNYQQDPVP